MELAAEARALKKKATPEQRNSLCEKRVKLQKEIDEFHRNARIYMPDVREKTPTAPSCDGDEWHDQDDDSDDEGILHPMPGAYKTVSDDGDRKVVDDIVNELSAETQLIRLPSTYGRENRSQSLAILCPVEKDLRIGQANDAIHSVRLCVADKSYHYRKKVRNAATNPNTGYRGRQSAFATAHAVDADIRKHARIYESARKALIALGLSEEEEDTYRQLRPGDTQASTAVVDFNARGQRNEGLSWIWQTPKALTNTSAWMEECPLSTLFLYLHQY